MIQYWRFYWPLALTGLAMVLAVQFQNAALARFPEAVTELAVFALAYSAYALFHASLNFIAQLSNVYARSPQGTTRSWRFATAASACIMLPLLALAHTDFGAGALEMPMQVRGKPQHDRHVVGVTLAKLTKHDIQYRPMGRGFSGEGRRRMFSRS